MVDINDFSKEERVMFEELGAEFDDQLVMTPLVSREPMDQVMAARTNSVIWKPMPYIAQSFDGSDATPNFKTFTQLSVPVAIGYQKHSPFEMSAIEYGDQLQDRRILESIKQKLASDINYQILYTAALYGSLVVTSDSASSSATATKTGFDKIAECGAVMNEQGVNMWDRKICLSSRDYNGMAGNLAARTLMNKSNTAYEKALIGDNVANFQAFQLDYAISCPANAASVTIGAANQYYTPEASSVAATGEQSNVDNRCQQITVDTTTGVSALDAFTVADVYAVHHIRKSSTGQLKTFRVVSVDSGTLMTITPPFISNGGSTDAEAQYQNIDSTPANGASLTFLNVAAKPINPFWYKGSIALTPGTIPLPSNRGVNVMRSSTESGIELVYQSWVDGNTQKIKSRCDVRFGVTAMNTEMMGVLLFSQT